MRLKDVCLGVGEKMADTVPPLVNAHEINSSSIALGEGRIGYRPLLYDGKPFYIVCPPGVAHVGLDFFKEKAYLPITFTVSDSTCFDALQMWLNSTSSAEYSSTEPQRMMKDQTVRLKVPLVDGVFTGGVFDQSSNLIDLSHLQRGSHVRCAVHASNLYSFNGRTGIVLEVVQLMISPPDRPQCLIADDGDECHGDDYVPFSPKKHRAY